MPGIEDLYPHAPQPIAPPQNGFSNLGPSGIIGLVQDIQDVQGKQGVAEAYRRNTLPDGTIDQPGLVRDLGQSGIHAGQAIGQAYSNASGGLGYGTAKTNALGNAFSSLAGMENPTKKDVYDLSARLSVAGLPAADIKKYQDFIISGGSAAGMKRNASVVGNQVLGQGAGELVQGGYEPTTQQPILVPRGQVNTRGATGGIVTQPMAGGPESVGASQKSLVEDQQRASGTLANLRNLDIALPFVQKLNAQNFGPGSTGWAKAKGALITAGIINPNTSDVTVRQEVGKYLLKYANAAQNAGRSDQALSAAIGSNPNLDLTEPANLNLIKNQVGLDKMDAAMPGIFKVEHPSEAEKATYSDYKSNYYNRIDRRVFSYDKLTPDERRDLVKSLGGPKSTAYKKFNQSYELAKQAGLITPEKTAQ